MRHSFGLLVFSGSDRLLTDPNRHDIVVPSDVRHPEEWPNSTKYAVLARKPFCAGFFCVKRGRKQELYQCRPEPGDSYIFLIFRLRAMRINRNIVKYIHTILIDIYHPRDTGEAFRKTLHSL